MDHTAAYDSLPHDDDDEDRSEYQKGGSINLESKGKTPTRGLRSVLTELALIISCILAHVLLVVFFVLLIVIQKQNDGQVLTFDESAHGKTSQYIYRQITNNPSWIIKVYTIPLLFITQKLALRRVVRAEHTLTAMDDQAHAWLGLGATVPVLWRYKDMFSKDSRRTRKDDLVTLAFLACVVLYLAASTVLGMVATNLFVFANTWGANGYQNLVSLKIMDQIYADHTRMLESFPVISVLPLLNSSNNVAMTTTGLWNNVVYNVPNYFSTLRVPASALIFQADCKILPHATQNKTHIHEKPARYVFSPDDSLEDVDFSAAMFYRTLNVRRTQRRDGTLLPTILVASTLSVVASNGHAAPWTPIFPKQAVETCGVMPHCKNTSQVQLFACNLNGLTSEVQLNTTTLPYGVDFNVSSPNASSWEKWSGPDNTQSLRQMSTLAYQFGSSSDQSQYGLTMLMGNITERYRYTLLEETLMEALGYRNISVPSISLQDLNSMLSRAFALVYWRTAIDTMALSVVEHPTDGSGYSPWHTRDLVFIDPTSPWYGLALSIVMLATAVIVTWQPKTRPKQGEHYKLEGLGVLQMTWLLGRDTRGTAVQLAYDPEPTLEHLRKRGKELRNPYPDI